MLDYVHSDVLCWDLLYYKSLIYTFEPVYSTIFMVIIVCFYGINVVDELLMINLDTFYYCLYWLLISFNYLHVN